MHRHAGFDGEFRRRPRVGPAAPKDQAVDRESLISRAQRERRAREQLRRRIRAAVAIQSWTRAVLQRCAAKRRFRQEFDASRARTRAAKKRLEDAIPFVSRLNLFATFPEDAERLSWTCALLSEADVFARLKKVAFEDDDESDDWPQRMRRFARTCWRLFQRCAREDNVNSCLRLVEKLHSGLNGDQFQSLMDVSGSKSAFFAGLSNLLNTRVPPLAGFETTAAPNALCHLLLQLLKTFVFLPTTTSTLNENMLAVALTPPVKYLVLPHLASSSNNFPYYQWCSNMAEIWRSKPDRPVWSSPELFYSFLRLFPPSSSWGKFITIQMTIRNRHLYTHFRQH